MRNALIKFLFFLIFFEIIFLLCTFEIEAYYACNCEEGSACEQETLPWYRWTCTKTHYECGNFCLYGSPSCLHQCIFGGTPWQVCTYSYSQSKITCNNHCSSDQKKYYYNCSPSCTDNGWQCFDSNCSISECLSSGCCDAGCNPTTGCTRNSNNSKCSPNTCSSTYTEQCVGEVG